MIDALQEGLKVAILGMEWSLPLLVPSACTAVVRSLLRRTDHMQAPDDATTPQGSVAVQTDTPELAALLRLSWLLLTAPKARSELLVCHGLTSE